MKYRVPFLLSRHGSTRATAYGFSNKSVTLAGKTHVVWLDAVAHVRGRTYDHAAGAWGETLELLDGYDNHTTPALVADAKGFLHIAYGPHGSNAGWNAGRFKHVVSETPNSLASWGAPVAFGYSATYACLIHTTAGRDAIAYRGGEAPCSLMFQKQRVRGGWASARELMRQDVEPQYTHVGATLVGAGDGTLFVAGHFYSLQNGYSAGVVVLRSTDLGETWTDVEGTPVTVPVLLDPALSVPHPTPGDVRVAGLGVDAAGVPWVATSSRGCACLSAWRGSAWQSVDVGAFMPAERLPEAGPITVDARGRIHMVTALRHEVPADLAWGHPSHEVFHLFSADAGATFTCTQVSEDDPTTANWLPSLSLSSPLQPVSDPVILYTHGEKGEGCQPQTETDVYCVLTESD